MWNSIEVIREYARGDNPKCYFFKNNNQKNIL